MYDLIVIGGGLTGCGIARDAAMRGLKVLLLEKEDFGSGASGADTPILHAPRRALFDDFSLLRSFCSESGILQKIASHLTFRIPCLLPVFRKREKSLFRGKIDLEKAEVFFEARDRYAFLRNGEPPARLSGEDVLALEPEMSSQVIGAVSFDEWGVDLGRLTLLNALSAHENGAVLKNHAEVVEVLRDHGRVVGVLYRDLLTGKKGEARASMTLNAAGPWAARIGEMAGAEARLRSLKTVHLSFDRRLTNAAVATKAIDGRWIFLAPNRNETLLGAAERDFFGDPDEVSVTEDEVEYLLGAAEEIFPKLREARVVRAWAGIQPFPFEGECGSGELKGGYEIFDHETRDGVSGFLSVVGGEAVNFRERSEEAVDLACRKLGVPAFCKTLLKPLPGSEAVLKPEEVAKKFEIPAFAAARLVSLYGTRTVDVLRLCASRPWERNLLCSGEAILEAEIRYAIRHEWARTLEDLSRRTHLALGPCQGADCLTGAAQIFGEELGLAPKQVFAQMRSFLEKRWRERRRALKGASLRQEELTRSIFLNLSGLHFE